MGKILRRGVAFLIISAFLLPPALAQEKKAKAEKVTGDVGLLDLEKNYMIIVTKEGKLVTLNFDNKTKVTKYTPQKAKVSDIGLGASVDVIYKDKIVELEQFEYTVKAKKGE